MEQKMPPQMLSYKAKNKAWRKKCVDWADSRSYLNYSPVRKSLRAKKINYDLIRGKVHVDDMKLVFNPNDDKMSFSPERIQHYPIIDPKINLLRGEEASRVFDYTVKVTNQNALTLREEDKTKEYFNQLQLAVQGHYKNQEELDKKIQELGEYMNFKWKDIREVRANALINHYKVEEHFDEKFNDGFVDAMTVAEEIYQVDIVQGEPTMKKLDPNKVRVFKSSNSDRIEDADIVVYEDWWSPGKIIDTFYDSLTPADIKKIENMPWQGSSTTMDGSSQEIDPRAGMVRLVSEDGVMDANQLFNTEIAETDLTMPYDFQGNVRVIRMYWKSKRKCKKVKYYDEDGEVQYKFRTEDYVCDANRGEEETIIWINQAWEGTKIGKDIYVNIRPCPIQYNRISNPSRCHFGIIGSIYNINGGKPYSLVDMMKPNAYMYDMIKHRLNEVIKRDFGRLVEVDFAKMPEGWTIDKYMYFAKKHGVMFVNSFKEGTKGAATGKIAGGLNNASKGVVDASVGDEINILIGVLAKIEDEIGTFVGISKQREGQISNRETVGGVERSTLQSSHITEWLFMKHDDTKKRVIEAFLEAAKIAMKGKSKKFDYIVPGFVSTVVEIDGDEFAENDYGLVVDNSQETQMLAQRIGNLTEVGLNSQTLTFSDAMFLYSSASIAEKRRYIENAERKREESQQQQVQQQQETLKENQQMALQQKQEEMAQRDAQNQRDNDTRIIVAQIQAQASKETTAMNAFRIDDDVFSEEERATLEENKRQFNEKMKLEYAKLAETKRKNSMGTSTSSTKK